MTDQEREQAGISRRSLIKRSAIVGGAAVWATPVVQSFTSPAGAQGLPTSGSPQCEPCFVFSITVGGTTYSAKTTFPDPAAQEAVCECIFATGDPFLCASTTPGGVTVPCGGVNPTPCECP